jgi:hypothetical protein
MQRYDENRDEELIELGVASEDTKGRQFGPLDTSGGRDIVGSGISDD